MSGQHDAPPDWWDIEAFGLPVLGRLRCAVRVVALEWHFTHRTAQLSPDLAAALRDTLPHNHTAAWGRGVLPRAERSTARERVLALGDDMARAQKAVWDLDLVAAADAGVSPTAVARVGDAHRDVLAWLVALANHEHRHHAAVDAMFNPGVDA